MDAPEEMINGLYEQAGYDLRIDYTQPVIPLLSPENADWIEQLLKEKGLRQ